MVWLGMDIDTSVGPEEVTIRVGGEPFSTLEREWWDEWADRIAGEPESCIEACLTNEEHAEFGDEQLRSSLEERGVFD